MAGTQFLFAVVVYVIFAFLPWTGLVLGEMACEIVSGKSVRQIHKWLFWLARRKCLNSMDARKIASFDLWTDLRDRNFGNVIRSSNGGYVSIDHESILHDLIWSPVATFELRSLLEEAKQHLSPESFQRFQIDMSNAANDHANGLVTAYEDLVDIINKIYPAHSHTLTPAILNLLNQRAQAGWMASTLGVIA